MKSSPLERKQRAGLESQAGTNGSADRSYTDERGCRSFDAPDAEWKQLRANRYLGVVSSQRVHKAMRGS